MAMRRREWREKEIDGERESERERERERLVESPAGERLRVKSYVLRGQHLSSIGAAAVYLMNHLMHSAGVISWDDLLAHDTVRGSYTKEILLDFAWRKLVGTCLACKISKLSRFCIRSRYCSHFRIHEASLSWTTARLIEQINRLSI